jgi:hypothetical protein
MVLLDRLFSENDYEERQKKILRDEKQRCPCKKAQSLIGL